MTLDQLRELIADAERRNGPPKGPTAAWQREVGPGDATVFVLPTERDAMTSHGYLVVGEETLGIPHDYVYGVANADGFFSDSPVIVPRSTLLYPLSPGRLACARALGYPTHPSRTNLIINFVRGGDT